MYADGDGLYLQVTSASARSWIFRYRRNGKTHEMGLGTIKIVTLAEAREKALEGQTATASLVRWRQSFGVHRGILPVRNPLFRLQCA
jgi:hypothetical protein